MVELSDTWLANVIPHIEPVTHFLDACLASGGRALLYDNVCLSSRCAAVMCVAWKDACSVLHRARSPVAHSPVLPFRRPPPSVIVCATAQSGDSRRVSDAAASRQLQVRRRPRVLCVAAALADHA